MKSLRQIDWLGGVVLCALVLGAVLGPIRWKVTERSRMIGDQRAALEGLAERENVENRLARTREQMTALQTRIADLHRSFPSRTELDTFLTEIHRLARDTDTELVRVVPERARPGEAFSKMPIRIEAVASFQAFYRFLWGLDRMARLSQVENLKITRAPTDRVCKVEMTLSIFVSTAGEVL